MSTYNYRFELYNTTNQLPPSVVVNGELSEQGVRSFLVATLGEHDYTTKTEDGEVFVSWDADDSHIALVQAVAILLHLEFVVVTRTETGYSWTVNCNG